MRLPNLLRGRRGTQDCGHDHSGQTIVTLALVMPTDRAREFLHELGARVEAGEPAAVPINVMYLARVLTSSDEPDVMPEAGGRGITLDLNPPGRRLFNFGVGMVGASLYGAAGYTVMTAVHDPATILAFVVGVSALLGWRRFRRG